MMTRIEQSIEVNAPAPMVYNQLTQFEDYPRFMEDIQEVRQVDDTHLHWRAKMNSHDMEWDAEIMEQVPEQVIAWRNTAGPIKMEKLEVRAVDQNRAKVTMLMEFEEQQQPAQGTDFETRIAEHAMHDLMCLKRFIESRGQDAGASRGEVQAGKENTLSSDKAGGQQSAVQQSATEQQPQQSGLQGAEQNSMLGAMTSMNPQSWLPNMLHAWEEPFVMMRKMTEDMDQIFEKFVGRPMYGSKQSQAAAPSGVTAWSPPLEVAQRDNQLVILAELPGVRHEDVHVEIKNDRLVIEGERREPQGAGQGYLRTERNYGHFYRAIALPQGTNPEQASASMRDGILEITVPVQQTQQPGRHVDIRSPG